MSAVEPGWGRRLDAGGKRWGSGPQAPLAVVWEESGREVSLTLRGGHLAQRRRYGPARGPLSPGLPPPWRGSLQGEAGCNRPVLSAGSLLPDPGNSRIHTTSGSPRPGVGCSWRENRFRTRSSRAQPPNSQQHRADPTPPGCGESLGYQQASWCGGSSS